MARRTTQTTGSTVTSLEDKLNAQGVRLDNVERDTRQNRADILNLQTQVDNDRAEVRRIKKFVKLLEQRLAETHDMAVTGHGTVSERRIDELAQELATKAILAGSHGGGSSFITALRAAKVDDSTIVESLKILRDPADTSPLKLTNDELFTELFTYVLSLGFIVDDVKGDVTQVKSEVTKQGMRLTGVEHAQGEMNTRLEHIEKGGIPWIALAVGFVAFLVTLVLYRVSFHEDIAEMLVSEEKVTTAVGSIDHQVTQHPDFWMVARNTWTFAFIVAILVGILFFSLVAAFTRSRKSKTTKTAKSKKAWKTDGKFHWNHVTTWRRKFKKSSKQSGAGTSSDMTVVDNAMANQNPNHPKSTNPGEPTRVMPVANGDNAGKAATSV